MNELISKLEAEIEYLDLSNSHLREELKLSEADCEKCVMKLYLAISAMALLGSLLIMEWWK